jgi:plastocyanin
MTNKKGIITALTLVLTGTAVAGIFLFSGRGPKILLTQSGTVIIRMGEDSYIPNEIKVKVGTKVTFLNEINSARWPASDLHPSHGIFPEFDPKRPIPAGESWEFTFDKVGEWGIHDHLSPYITGKIIVVP